MNQKNHAESGKTRQNVSLSPATKELFAQLAKDKDTTMSALLTSWILEKAAEKKPTPMIVALKNPQSPKNAKEK